MISKQPLSLDSHFYKMDQMYSLSGSKSMNFLFVGYSFIMPNSYRKVPTLRSQMVVSTDLCYKKFLFCNYISKIYVAVGELVVTD